MIERAQIDIFIDGLTRYFTHLDIEVGGVPGALEIDAPYLLKSSQTMGQEYTGMISVSGENTGTIFITAGSALLKRILLSYGEQELNNENLKRDLIGEVANTLAGNARKYLGAGFHISTPKVLQGPLQAKRLQLDSRCFVLPFRWRSSKAELIVSLGS